MGQVVAFPNGNITWRVSFNVLTDAPLRMNKSELDDFSVQIVDGVGTAFIPATSRDHALQKLTKVLPGATIHDNRT